jgi:hypothetical protein
MSETVSRPDGPSEGPIRVEFHPPERGGRGGPIILPCGCCCCCCCCLHSLGSLVGGLVGTAQPIKTGPRPVDPDFPFPYRRDEFELGGAVLPAGTLYWLLVLFGMGLCGVWVFLSHGLGRTDPSGTLLEILAYWVLGLPAIQLGASVVAALAVVCFYSDKAAAGARIGKITLWSLVGTLIGAAAIGGCCGVFGLLK